MTRTITAILAIIARALLVVVAAVFVALIVLAQSTCSLVPSIGTRCHDERGDIWMLPFFAAPIGIPALIASIAMIATALRRRA